MEEELKNKNIKEIENKIKLLIDQRTQTSNDYSTYLKITEEINYLKDKLLFENGPVLSNQVIDLYLDEEKSTDEEFMYMITLHKSIEKIGWVKVSLESFSYFSGNINYEINKEYRGHGYTFQALQLLKDTMIEKDLTNPIITASPNNIPSIKIIEKFGGKLVTNRQDELNWNVYEVDLLEEDNKKVK